MKKEMHRNIGVLTFTSKSSQNLNKGTACLISPNIALTAAHSLYNGRGKFYHQKFKFYPGACGLLNNHYEVEDYFVPEQFILNGGVANDYALLKLEKCVRGADDFMPLNSNMEELTREGKLSIYGYPAINTIRETETG